MTTVPTPQAPAGPMKLVDYLKQARVVEQKWAAGGAQPRKLAVLSSFSADFLKPYLVVESDPLVPLRPWFAPFGQLEQMVLDPGSEFWASEPQVVWVATRLEDVEPRLAHEYGTLDPESLRRRTVGLAERLVGLARAIRERSRASILVSNFILPYGLSASSFDANDPDGLVFHVSDANRTLARELRSLTDANVFDYAGVVADSGVQAWRDTKLFHMARVPCGTTQQPVLARQLARTVAGVLRPSAKCIVCDLDNTLWGGVLGDDGMQGLKLGDDYPGSAFQELQNALLGFRKRGVLLAVASKNDEATVLEMLDQHPDQILRREHFAHIAANWEPKPQNLERIAKALNIGLESLVFLDDNPVEREQVKAALPMVHVVEMPTDPLLYAAALRGVALLDQPRILSEDRDRAAMYKQDEERQKQMEGASTTGDFLTGLDMKAEVGVVDEKTFARVHQLIHKTNQFNLTTRRHEAATLQSMVDSDKHVVAWLRLEDRYGDMGLVCVGIASEVSSGTWEVDTFLMSCRVMGRRVEEAFIAFLSEQAAKKGAARLVGLYKATAKNHIVRDLFPKFGFSEIERSSDGDEIKFGAAVAEAPSWPTPITRKEI